MLLFQINAALTATRFHHQPTRYRQCELTYSTASAVLSRRVELLSRT